MQLNRVLLKEWFINYTLSICLSNCLSICPSFTHSLSITTPFNQTTFKFIYITFCLSVYLGRYIDFCICIYVVSICLSIYTHTHTHTHTHTQRHTLASMRMRVKFLCHQTSFSTTSGSCVRHQIQKRNETSQLREMHLQLIQNTSTKMSRR